MEGEGNVAEAAAELDREKMALQKTEEGDVHVPYLVRMVVKYPCRVMCLSMGTSLLLVAILLGCMAGGVIQFELDTNPDSFNVKFDDMADRWDAAQAITDSGKTTDYSPAHVKSSDPLDDASNSTHDRTTPKATRGGNIFDEDHLAEILAFEKEVVKLDGYTDFCARKDGDYSAPCEEFFFTPRLITHAEDISMPQQVYGCCDCDGNATVASTPANKVCASKSSVPVCINPHGGSNVTKGIVPNGKASSMASVKTILPNLADTLGCGIETEKHSMVGVIKGLFDRKFSSANPTSSSTRSYMSLGVWFKRSEQPSGTKEEREKFWEKWENEQWAKMEPFGIVQIKNLVDKHNADESKLVRIAWFGPSAVTLEILQGILGSAQIVMVAMVIVLIYMVYHTKSIFLGVLGQAHVLISFPVTWFFYRVVFQLHYMGMLNFISMFVIIGIGADDIFVFVDAWKQAKLQGPKVNKDLETRMAWAWRRASSAMLITSLTDACAFYVNIFSSVIVVRIFGVFMGTLVMINYILVITWFPAVVIVYTRLWPDEKWGRKNTCSCWGRCSVVGCTCCPHKSPVQVGNNKQATERGAAEEPRSPPKPHPIEHFFREVYAPKVMKSPVHRGMVAFVFLVFVSVFLAFAVQIKASEKDFKAESFLNSTNLMRMINTLDRFQGARDFEIGHFMWGSGNNGMKAVNRKGADNNNPKDFGSPVFDDYFDPYSVAAQEHVIKTCNWFRENKYIVYDPSYPKEKGIYCHMEHFRDWVIAVNKTFPVADREEFGDLIANFTAQPSQEKCAGLTYNKYCLAYYYTIQNYPSTLRVGPDELENAWAGDIRWRCTGDIGEECTKTGSISHLAIRFNVSIKWDTGALYARPIADSLEAIMKKANEAGGDHMQGFQFIRNLYVNMRTQEIMYVASFTGAAVSGLVAFLVLCFSTMNILVSAYAMLNIMGIVISCIGYMVMIGWQLGTIEGICITVCIGFSVDFVVHVAIAYIESKAASRYEKVRQALGEMGISVVGATLTTGVSSLIMIFAPMIPFSKIGIFIVFDIFMSLLFAIGLFPAMLASFGPEGDSGSIEFILKASWCPYMKKAGIATRAARVMPAAEKDNKPAEEK
eukprot:g8586.t1